MGWKCEKISTHAMVVKDISYTGMQISCSGDVDNLVIGDVYSGLLKWSGEHLEIKGKLSGLRQNMVKQYLVWNLTDQMA